MWRANATILIVLAGVITAIGLDAKPWPFNNYPMFACTVQSWSTYWSRGDVAAHLALFPVGVDGDGKEHVMESRHVTPQYPVSMMMAFNKMLGNRRSGSMFAGGPAEPGVADLRQRAKDKQVTVRKALQDITARYNQNRQPDEVPLVGMRLYLMKRDFSDPATLSLTDAMTRAPSLPYRELIFEAMPDGDFEDDP